MNFDHCINKIKTFVPLNSINTALSLKVVSQGVLIAGLVLMGTSAMAGPREQAKRMHDRLAGVPPAEPVLCVMSELISAGQSRQAAHVVMSLDPENDSRIPGLAAAKSTCGVTTLDNAGSRKAFYSTSLRDLVTPWTNRLQTKHADFNDYVALVIGMIRDDEPFDTVLSTDLYYQGGGGASGVSAYSASNNNHFRDLGNGGYDLSDSSVLAQGTRSLPGGASPAGVTTTRAAGLSYFSNGTNRRMLRFTAINYLCRDLEQMKDPTRSHDRVRQDASRSPGGDSTIFLTNCVGCHAGMDGMAAAYAYWEWLTVDNDGDGNPDEDAGRLLYKENYDAAGAVSSAVSAENPNGVANKYHINAGNFPFGFRTADNNWVNYWRRGPNSSFDWDFNPDPAVAAQDRGKGFGAASMGREIAATKAFAQCQVEKVYKHVCLQDPVANDETAVNTIIDELRTDTVTSARGVPSTYNMRNVFAKVAPLCMGN